MNNIDGINLKLTMQRLGICILIPTYNNGGTLNDIISRVLRYSNDVIIVNDGSSDETESILENYINELDIISYNKNRGKGYAIKQGFKRAKELGYKYVITIDSDGQHYPEDLPLFVKAITENYGSLIIGERNLSKVDINGKSSFANKFSNFWFYIQTGKRLNDTQTGYRAYPLDKIKGISLLTNRYEAELELLVFASWHGTNIISIPIRVHYASQDERISHFKPGLDFTRISILNTFLCLLAIVYGLPLRIWNVFKQKKIFRKEFKPFTRKKGKQKEAATTLGRLGRSIYGMAYFVFWSMGVFTPFAYLYFSIGKNTESKRLRFHKMLQWISRFLTKRFPGCQTFFENPNNETFETPALIICNHQSHLDLPVLMSVNPKLIFLTNDWVWNNFFYGKIIHNAEFLPVSEGLEAILPRLKNLKERGYSIVVFPEGTRSADCSILRFHQGAFYLARELQLDIVPMVLHGAGHYLPKKDFMFRKGVITLKILKREIFDKQSDITLRAQASYNRRLIQKEYDEIVLKKELFDYFKSLVLYKYAYRGWHIVSRCKKTLREMVAYKDIINERRHYNNVRIINSGIGTFALMYALVNKDTEVFAFESNIEDYRIASGTADLPQNLHFVHAIWNEDFTLDNIADLTIRLSSPISVVGIDSNEIYLPIKS